MDDGQLVKKCLKGNAKAQRALYDRFSTKMMGVCYRYARNKMDAEDVLQEGFIKVFTSLDQFKFEGPLEGWIRKIMVNTALNFLKKNEKFRKELDLEENPAFFSKENAEASLFHKDILKMMQLLPLGYKTVLNLYAVEGYSHKEIGELLQISEATSRSQYSRAKKQLEKIQAHFDLKKTSQFK